MLKCGQENNSKYSFGIKECPLSERKVETNISCSSCGKKINNKMAFCPSCGEKIK